MAFASAPDSFSRRSRIEPAATLIVFDWDDTLFCTSHYEKLHVLFGWDASSALVRAFLELDRTIKAVLERSLTLGRTVIVTNARAGWVEKCAKAFLPEVSSTLARGTIEVVSARSRFEHTAPTDPVAWKCGAFEEIGESSPDITNLVSVGDQEAEMQAVRALSRRYDAPYTKSVRMLERPTVMQLCGQLRCLCRSLREVVERRGGQAGEPLHCKLQERSTAFRTRPTWARLVASLLRRAACASSPRTESISAREQPSSH